MSKFKFILSQILNLLNAILLIQSDYSNSVLHSLKEKNNQNLFYKIILCGIYALPLAIFYGFVACFIRSILYAFFVMGLNWLDNWYVYFCLQFPSVKKYMFFYSYIMYSDYSHILFNPVDYKQLFVFMIIKIAASFSSRIFLITWFSWSFTFFWKGILQFPNYWQLLMITLVKLVLFFENSLISHENNSLLFFALLTYLIFLLIISVIFVLFIIFKNLFSSPEDYEEYLELTKHLNNKKSNNTKQ